MLLELLAVLMILCFSNIQVQSSVTAVQNSDSEQHINEEDLIFYLSSEQRESLLRKSGILSEEDIFDATWLSQIRQTYKEYGLVLIRGLLDPRTIQRLAQAGDSLVHRSSSSIKTFRTLQFGPMFLYPPPPSSSSATCSNDDDEDKKKQPTNFRTAFRDVALHSAIPTFIAQILLQFNYTSGHNLRVVNDVFLAKGHEQGYCGWHVDDLHFWPTSFFAADEERTEDNSSKDDIDDSTLQPAMRTTRRLDGVNAWIAMDDIDILSNGGGMALVPKSHVAEWRYDAYNTIGSLPVHPSDGFTSAEHMFRSFPATTCDLASASPDLNALMDNEALVFHYKKGDVLLVNRWIWHKSIPLSQSSAAAEHPLKRYSIRYEEGKATLVKGFATHPSVMYNADNSGKSLDNVCETSGPFFPRAYPSADDAEMSQFQDLVDHKFLIADARKKVIMDEARKYFFARGQYYTI
eukprot:CAMPEP_0172422222 /NCGR_PEP_ID=MMETSP1064-20121228/8404_1 /TAXON_ID=202472 /ORGANISM="Aulacoseira subarctica , Strain CCAP 1002/5" /LENGTH=461 /DNA_ID=CAMNT_0013162991 /DNA_START=47 /DNA_END=1432 /DNA_ORIENTATION=-